MVKLSNSDIKEKIIQAGLKSTHQRIVIYAALVQRHDHPTADKLFEYISPENPSISLGTLYKTLENLATVGLITKVKSDEGNYRYDANIDNHNHIYCVNTNEIIDYKDQELDSILAAYFKTKKIKNLKITDIRLQINGERLDIKKTISIQ